MSPHFGDYCPHPFSWETQEPKQPESWPLMENGLSVCDSLTGVGTAVVYVRVWPLGYGVLSPQTLIASVDIHPVKLRRLSQGGTLLTLDKCPHTLRDLIETAVADKFRPEWRPREWYNA